MKATSQRKKHHSPNGGFSLGFGKQSAITPFSKAWGKTTTESTKLFAKAQGKNTTESTKLVAKA